MEAAVVYSQEFGVLPVHPRESFQPTHTPAAYMSNYYQHRRCSPVLLTQTETMVVSLNVKLAKEAHLYCLAFVVRIATEIIINP